MRLILAIKPVCAKCSAISKTTKTKKINNDTDITLTQTLHATRSNSRYMS